MILFENLDLTPIRSILWKGLHLEGSGRPVTYNPECDLRALMLRQLEQIPYMKDLVKRIARNPNMHASGDPHVLSFFRLVALTQKSIKRHSKKSIAAKGKNYG